MAVLIAGVLFSLSEITERGRAEPLSAVYVAFLLDDLVTDEEFEAVQAQAAADPSGLVSLSPLDVDLRSSEVAGLDREETSLLFAGELTAVLYAEGTEAAEALILEPGLDEEGESQEAIELGPASFLTASQHSTFRTFFFVALAIVIGLLGLVAFLSRGLGRLGAPAVVLALSVGPLVALWVLASSAVGTSEPDESLYTVIARDVIGDTARDLRGSFLAIFMIALASVAIAFIGNLLTPLGRKINRKYWPAMLRRVKRTPRST